MFCVGVVLAVVLSFLFDPIFGFHWFGRRSSEGALLRRLGDWWEAHVQPHDERRNRARGFEVLPPMERGPDDAKRS